LEVRFLYQELLRLALAEKVRFPPLVSKVEIDP
jgi:hypothetical protein